MNYKKILSYLYSLESPNIKLGLQNVQNLLDRIGNPEKKLKCIHVAGTNGKGSVCAMLQSVLVEHGYKTGMYTSPHLKKFNERIRINNSLISDKEIVELFLKVKPFITTQSFFEITTAMAFLYFYEKKADYVVLEVGLGGRLDATNVVIPLVSVITNIGLEHTELLGNTIEKIAYEKSGIIKRNIPVVTGAKGNALKIIRRIAKEKSSPIYFAKKHKKTDFKFLNGSFQQENKDIALTATSILKKYNKIKLNNKKIMSGLKKTKWPARLQFVSGNAIIDGSHNLSGFSLLAKELEKIKNERKFEEITFVIGVQSDKDAASMLKAIRHLACRIIFTKSKNEKAMNPGKLAEIFEKINKNKKIEIKIIKNPKYAFEFARKNASKKELVVATGSLYLAGELV